MNAESTTTTIEGTGQGIAATSNSEFLSLDLPERTVALKMRDGGGIRRHVFRRLERADVDAYFAATVVATTRSGQAVENEVDLGSAELSLYARAIVRVTGYELEGGGDLMQLTNWKDRVPGAHRIRAVDLLVKVLNGTGGQVISADHDIVSLDAIWTEGTAGSMSWHRGLLHRFTPPTIVHWKRFNSFKTRSVPVGGSRTQKTVYPKLDKILSEFYDELIQSVDGYSLRGAPLADKAAIVAEMDRFHKISAVAALFDKSELDSSDDEEAG